MTDLNFSPTVFDQLDSPALVIFPKIVRQNIANALQLVSNDPVRLRPHIKTVKSAEAVQMLLDVGIYQFKCATIAEAELLGSCGARDVLLAYQPIEPKLQRFIALIQQFPNTKFSCLVDNSGSAHAQSAAFAAHGLRVPVYLDLNVGFNRTGILPDDSAFELYEYCTQLIGIQPVGLHAYDGHLRYSGFVEQTAAVDAAFNQVNILKEKILRGGFSEPTIVAGGSPSFPVHAQREGVVCSPGTFVYWDAGYGDLFPDYPFEPAAFVLTRVVSSPTPTSLCLDLGHKSIAAENPIDKRVFLKNADHFRFIGQSEEHLVAEVGANHGYKIGDFFLGKPYHVCPTVALHERAYAIENEQVVGEWLAVARDRRLEF
jgi:D-threonine aldolase